MLIALLQSSTVSTYLIDCLQGHLTLETSISEHLQLPTLNALETVTYLMLQLSSRSLNAGPKLMFKLHT
jgi:hypothetical protein